MNTNSTKLTTISKSINNEYAALIIITTGIAVPATPFQGVPHRNFYKITVLVFTRFTVPGKLL